VTAVPHELRPSRSVLAVPASNRRMVEKAITSAADMIFLDLEDAVAPSEKAGSRDEVIRAFRDLSWGSKPRMYRVNALATPWFYRDLINVVEAVGDQIDLVLVPKVERPEDVLVVSTLLSQIEAAVGLGRRIGIEVQIESAAGVLAAERIAAADDRIEAIVFGPGDFAASIGMPMTSIGAFDEGGIAYPGHRLHGVMQHLVLAGRAAGVRVIDGPFADLRDTTGLRRSSEIARALGFDGKWCIHPAQIDTINDVFSPTEDELAWARRVVDAYEQSLADGQGAMSVDGRMVDAASVRIAELTLQRRGGTKV